MARRRRQVAQSTKSVFKGDIMDVRADKVMSLSEAVKTYVKRFALASRSADSPSIETPWRPSTR
ncbi:MAG: hypothetical protein MZV70_12770 [Desulfobacterales bacterium]|nr:hypothetical protein [Desulfobacterales bacterium]